MMSLEELYNKLKYQINVNVWNNLPSENGWSVYFLNFDFSLTCIVDNLAIFSLCHYNRLKNKLFWLYSNFPC